MWRRRTRANGFTLVEILCVVVILGIAAAVVVPSLGSRNDLVAAAAAREVVADLLYAQNQAIVNQTMVYANFDTTHQQYSLATTAPNALPVTYLSNPVTGKPYQTVFQSAATTSFKNVALQTVSCDGNACLAFDELGQPYSVNTGSGTATLLVNTATIPVQCGTYTLTVTVEPYTGAMQVQ